MVPLRPRGVAAPPVSRAMALRANLQGRRARKEGKPLTACPYIVDGELTQRFQARFWIQGFRHADHGDSGGSA